MDRLSRKPQKPDSRRRDDTAGWRHLCMRRALPGGQPPQPQRPFRPIAAGKRFAGAPSPNTYGACDLLMITLPSTLTTVDLQHGYRSRGPVFGEHATSTVGSPIWTSATIIGPLRLRHLLSAELRGIGV